MKRVWMFPGQGSQELGMGRTLSERSKDVQILFERAEEITRRPIQEIAFEGPKELLDRTSNTQVALLVVSLGVLAVYLKSSYYEEAGPPDFVVGHSVGEFAAAVGAGAMSAEDAITVVNERGLAMEEAGNQYPGKMAALLKIKDAVAERIALANGAYVANYNIPDQQIVISGESGAVDAAVLDAEEAGAKAITLGVTIPAHSPLMLGAVESVRGGVDSIAINDPLIPMVANSTGALVANAAELSEMLPNQLVSPVKWGQGVEFLHSQGVEHFIEFGSKSVLSGMVKRQLGNRGATVEHAETTLLGAK